MQQQLERKRLSMQQHTMSSKQGVLVLHTVQCVAHTAGSNRCITSRQLLLLYLTSIPCCCNAFDAAP